MLNFKFIDVQAFLKNYWQKKPLVIPKALVGFVNPLTPDELAGLAMEEEIDSRLVIQSPSALEDGLSQWSLKQGPFIESDFSQLPTTNWTLLVQGVDRFVPEVTRLLDNFNFIPNWRIDDVMISYAVKHGSVGPHYDNYDVFLYQAQGQRRWSLTTKDCNPDNYRSDTALKIMKTFAVEEEFILEAGDMLYLPAHVGHHGVSLSDDCLTYSFGFRSYHDQELLDNFADYVATQKSTTLYIDPDWQSVLGTTEIPKPAWLAAKKVIQSLLDDETLIKEWFASFVTTLDAQAESLLPEEYVLDNHHFLVQLLKSRGLIRHAVCRFAYIAPPDNDRLLLYINGCQWDITHVTVSLVKKVANQRYLSLEELQSFLTKGENLMFLGQLWARQWLNIVKR